MTFTSLTGCLEESILIYENFSREGVEFVRIGFDEALRLTRRRGWTRWILLSLFLAGVGKRLQLFFGAVATR